MKKILLGGLAGTFLAGAALTGCASDPMDVSFGGVTSNMTPELMTLNQRDVDVRRHMAYAQNVNWRLFWEDLGRGMLTDSPSRLSPNEIVSVSGKPH